MQANGKCGTLNVRDGFLICPECRRNRRLLRIEKDTVAENLPVYCRDCRREIIVNIDKAGTVKVGASY